MNSLVTVQNNKEYGLVTTSRIVAEGLSKEHSKVIRTLENLILETPDLASLIIPTTYKVKGQKREYKEYLLTKDGFTLYMFNIQGYNDFKMAYIKEFNRMERLLNGEQLELEAYKLEKKTYKGKPVMTVRDIVFLTDNDRSSVNVIIKNNGYGRLISSNDLKVFKKENKGFSLVNSHMYILYKGDVISILNELNDLEHLAYIDEYFGEDLAYNVTNKVLAYAKLNGLLELLRVINRYSLDDDMKRSLYKDLSVGFVKFGLLDKLSDDLDINSKDGWNLLGRVGEFKRVLLG